VQTTNNLNSLSLFYAVIDTLMELDSLPAEIPWWMNKGWVGPTNGFPWFGLVFWVPFSTLTLTKGHLACKKTCASYSKKTFSKTKSTRTD